MIVKNNSNVAAKNGFCSIARAPMNELGENFILNFDYYVQKKILTRDEIDSLLYINSLYDISTQIDCQPDFIDLDNLNLEELNAKLEAIEQSSDWNCYGYCDRLNTLNTYQRYYQELVEKYYIPLNQAKSDLSVAEAGVSAANDAIMEAADAFYNLTAHNISDYGFDISLDTDGDNTLTINEVVELLDKNTEAKRLAYEWINQRIQLNK